ncbi:MAG: hypothetical protein JO339_17525 [Alphaproteobacteria bacterium]|nr:hypothetical protein [Alphaproteobacteria bacterium]
MARSADREQWWAALLFGSLLLLLLLIGAWALRIVMPVAPAVGLSAVQLGARPAAKNTPDPVPALKASLDAARSDEKRLAAELARRVEDLKKSLEQCRPSGPALPAEGWSKGDLGTLKGCWVLGRDVPMLHTLADGSKEPVTIMAGRICLDDQGGGFHEQVTLGPTSRWDCKAPLTAKFWRNGTLVARQPPVLCQGEPPMQWTATQITCHRVDDDTALCQAVDKSGRTDMELRRER